MSCPACNRKITIESVFVKVECEICRHREQHYEEINRRFREEKKHKLWANWMLIDTPGGRTYIGIDGPKELIIVFQQNREKQDCRRVTLFANRLRELL